MCLVWLGVCVFLIFRFIKCHRRFSIADNSSVIYIYTRELQPLLAPSLALLANTLCSPAVPEPVGDPGG